MHYGTQVAHKWSLPSGKTLAMFTQPTPSLPFIPGRSLLQVLLVVSPLLEFLDAGGHVALLVFQFRSIRDKLARHMIQSGW